MIKTSTTQFLRRWGRVNTVLFSTRSVHALVEPPPDLYSNYHTIEHYARELQLELAEKEFEPVSESLKQIEEDTTALIDDGSIDETRREKINYCKMVMTQLRAQWYFDQDMTSEGMTFVLRVLNTVKQLEQGDNEHYFYSCQRILETFELVVKKLARVMGRERYVYQVFILLTLFIENHLRRALRGKLSEHSRSVFTVMLADALLLRGGIHSLMCDNSKGIVDLCESVELSPSPSSYLALSFLQLRTRRTDSALISAERALKLSNKDQELRNKALILMSQCFMKKKNYKLARDISSEVIQSDPSLEAYGIRVLCSCILHDFQMVIKDIQQLNVDHLSLYFQQLCDLDHFAMYEEAMTYGRNSSNNSHERDVRDSVQVLTKIIEIHRLMHYGQYEGARVYFNVMKYTLPAEYRDELWSLEADILLQCKLYREAYYVLDKAKTQNLQDEILKDSQVAHALAGMDSFQRAERIIKDRTQDANNLPDELATLPNLRLKFAYAHILSLQPTKRDEAIEVTKYALEQASKLDLYQLVVPLLGNLASLYQDLGRYDESRKHLKRALEIAPNHLLLSHM